MRYRLADGTFAPNRDVNNHHVFFEKRWYRTQAEHRFRNLGGLVIPMHIPVHDDLHARVRPPLKPSPELREQVTEFAHDFYGDPYEGFEQIATFLGDIANSSWSQERAVEAYLIHDNLIQQQPFIEKGHAEPVERVA